MHLDCQPSPDGILSNCQVKRESLPGYGFGEAALGLTSWYRLSPEHLAVFGDQPVGLTIEWLHPDYKRAAVAAAAGRYEEIATVNANQIGWARRASGDDMARFYPDAAMRAEESGSAVVICFITISGALSNCLVQKESPEGQEFGLAATRVMRLFRAKLVDIEGRPVAGKAIRTYLAFRPPEPPPAAP